MQCEYVSFVHPLLCVCQRLNLLIIDLLPLLLGESQLNSADLTVWANDAILQSNVCSETWGKWSHWGMTLCSEGVTSRSGTGALGRWRPRKWTAAGVVTDCGFEPSIWWIHLSGTSVTSPPSFAVTWRWWPGRMMPSSCPHIADVLLSARTQPLFPPNNPARWQQRVGASYTTQLHYDQLN